MVLRISSDYFCKQQQPIDICNGDSLCFFGEEVTFQLCKSNYVCYQWCNQTAEVSALLAHVSAVV